MSKLSFKPLSTKDAKLIFDNREYNVVRFSTGGMTKKEFDSWTVKDEERFVKQMVENVKDGKMKAFVIFRDDEYVGRCMLHQISEKDKFAAVSLSIKEELWGQGYGRQIVSFLEKLAFSKFKLNRLEYCCYSNNPRSQKLSEKCGYKYEGTQRQAKKIGTKYYDRLIHSKLKSEYKKINL